MLKLNGDKTEFIMFEMKKQLAKIYRIDININGTTIQTVESVHNLDYFMDCFMKNSHHISKISGSLYGLLKDVRSICLHINQDTAKILVQALVLSKLDYCNSLLLSSAQYELDKLQRVQNMACRVVYNLRKYDHVTAYMSNLHYLRICECITYKPTLLMFKINKKEASKYLCDLVTPNSIAKCTLRSVSTSTFKPIFCKSTFVGPRTWNGLPSDIRNESDEETLKKKLKSHLYKCPMAKKIHSAVQCQWLHKWTSTTTLH